MGVYIADWRHNAGQSIAAVLTLLFVAGFYGLHEPRLHKTLFYTALAVTVLLALTWQDLQSLGQRLTVFVGVYIAYQIASLGMSSHYSPVELGEAVRKAALTCGFLVLIQRLWRDSNALNLFWRGMAWIAGAAVIAALLVYAVMLPEDSRLYQIGRSENAVQAGILCAIAALIIAAVALSPDITKSERFSLGVLWIASIAALLLTQSRGALLGAFSAHGVLWMMGRSGRGISCKTLLASLVALIGALLILSFWIDWSQLIARADGYRLMIWSEALARWSESPLFGLGYRTPFAYALPYGETIYQPHSLYISALLYGGVVGLLVLLVLFGAVFVQLIHHRNQPYALLALALLVNAAVIALVDFDLLLVNSGLEWLLFWLPVASALGVASTARESAR